MIVLAFIFWLILILLGLFVLLLFLNLRFRLQGQWRDSLDFTLVIGVGPLYFMQQPAPGGERETVIKIGQRTLSRKINTPPTQTKSESREKHTLQDVRPFLRGDFLQSIVRTVRDILAGIREKEVRLQGFWGFNDPYYTGLLAACLVLIPGLEVKPVYNQAYRDLEFKLGGRLLIGSLVYNLIKFMVTRESRQVWRAVLKRKKRKNLSPGATSWKTVVYSTVK